jgi:hypothetical protein
MTPCEECGTRKAIAGRTDGTVRRTQFGGTGQQIIRHSGQKNADGIQRYSITANGGSATPKVSRLMHTQYREIHGNVKIEDRTDAAAAGLPKKQIPGTWPGILA